MSDRIERSDRRFPDSQNGRIRQAYQGKPSPYQFTSRGMIVGSGNPRGMVQRDAPTAASLSLGRKHVRSANRRTPIRRLTSAVVTGGIGDFMAIESFLTQENRSSITQILLATRASRGIIELIRSCPSLQHWKPVEVWNDFTRFFCFYSLEEVAIRLEGNRHLHRLVSHSADLSIMKVFAEIEQSNISCQSSFMMEPLADIEKYSLPENFFAICPYTINDERDHRRNVTPPEWESILRIMESKNTHGVVLNIGNGFIPSHPLLIDFSNKTTLPESIEILKKSHGYLGIDSSLSVLATKLHSAKNLAIKSVNPHLQRYRSIYYAPHSEFNFITENLIEYFEEDRWIG